jgi:hypothetical protein
MTSSLNSQTLSPSPARKTAPFTGEQMKETRMSLIRKAVLITLPQFGHFFRNLNFPLVLTGWERERQTEEREEVEYLMTFSEMVVT